MHERRDLTVGEGVSRGWTNGGEYGCAGRDGCRRAFRLASITETEELGDRAVLRRFVGSLCRQLGEKGRQVGP